MDLSISENPHFDTQIIFTSKDEKPAIDDFGADIGEITLRYENGLSKIFCGIGEKNSCALQTIRETAAKAIQKAIDLKRNQVSVIAFNNSSEPLCGSNNAVIEGILLGSYKFSKYKTEKPHDIKTVEIAGEQLNKSDIKRTETICKAVSYSRDLVNSNASEVTPQYLAKEALELECCKELKVTVLDEKEMSKKQLNLINAVGSASSTPARLIIMEYIANKNDKSRTAIVGKGITFDSGGQNLKPTGHIETMRSDMAGAASVLGIMKALVELKPSINVIGVIGAAHNAIGAASFFPGDIYKSYNGKTVEICSTDAEGRLVLADAISYCIKNFKPNKIIDFATLTGGVVVALGEMVAGLFSNNNELADKLFKAGEKSGEQIWRLPLYKQYSESIKSDIADLRNLSKFKKGTASSITAAAFIQEFIEDTPWAHIDIAGTAFNEGSQRGEIPQFATGFGVRLFFEYILDSSN